jgi:hypothetical protein
MITDRGPLERATDARDHNIRLGEIRTVLAAIQAGCAMRQLPRPCAAGDSSPRRAACAVPNVRLL